MRIFKIVIFLLFVPTLCWAELPEQLTKDYQAIDGYVVMQIENEYLIDLDASKGIRAGDIFSLVVPGEKIVHPVTGEVIGTLDSNKGFLRVTRLKSGYSYAELLPGSDSIKKGAPIRRYDQVPALLQSDPSVPEETRQELRTMLPQFEWLATEDDEVKPLIIFELGQSSLTIQTATGNQLNSYLLDESGFSGSEQQITPIEVATPPAIIEAPIKPVAPVAVEKAPEETGSDSVIIRRKEETQQGVWYGPDIDEAVVGMTVGDFDGDGRNETAIASERNILIGRKEENRFQMTGKIPVSVSLKVLAIDSIDIDGDGSEEVTVSAFGDNGMESFLIAYRQEMYQIIEKDIEWHLRVVNFQGEGAVLLGQKMSRNENYYQDAFRVAWDGMMLVQDETISLPPRVNIYSVAPFVDRDGKTVFAYLTTTDFLKVTDNEGDVLWESPDYVGGSEVRFERQLGNADSEGIYFIPSRVVVAQTGEILANRSEGHRVVAGYREFKKGQILAFEWNGLTMNETWKTKIENGYLADFAMADVDNDGIDELAAVVKFKHKGMFGKKARSAMVVYELQ